jgi:hypothetical protein
MKLPKNIRIESDGTPAGTHAFDAKSGVEIHGIRRIEWSIEAGKGGTAKIVFPLVEVSVLGETHAEFQVLTPVEKP